MYIINRKKILAHFTQRKIILKKNYRGTSGKGANKSKIQNTIFHMKLCFQGNLF